MGGDPQSSVYEGMLDADVQKALMHRLQMQHPDIDIPQPTDFFISRHGYDSNSYGAYSISLAGWDDNLHSTLARPIKDACGKARIRLAGEAMCDNLNGYTHGAYQSGKECAARYLYDHGRGADPALNATLSLCDFSPSKAP